MAVSSLEYKALLDKLFSVNLHGGIKFGLHNIERLNQALENPLQHYSCIHVAGSNGKGSVVTKIAAGLETCGYRVGIYTSPHISSFRERIKVNGKLIDESSIVQILNKIFAIIESEKIPATFFEITTALALVYFAEQNVDYAVLETGLGGRLDATNIVTPKLSIITSICLEHTEYLGHTMEDIALEKAGIIKPSVPIIIGPCVPKHVIEKVASKQNSPLIVIEGQYDYFNDENNAIAEKALQTLHVSKEAISEGLKVLPPCRMEVVSLVPPVILDVGHNPDGLRHLFQAVKKKYPHSSLRIVFGLSKSKDIDGCLEVLKSSGDHFHLVEATNGRGLEVAILYQKMIKLDINDKFINIDETIHDSIQNALKAATKNSQVLVICGTFFIMNEARAALGIHEPRDDYDMNEKGQK